MTMTTYQQRPEAQLLRFSEVRNLLRARGLGIRMVLEAIATGRLRPVENLPVQHARYRRRDVLAVTATPVLTRGQVFHLLRKNGLGKPGQNSHGRPALFDEWRASGLLSPVPGLPGTRARYCFATVRKLIRERKQPSPATASTEQ